MHPCLLSRRTLLGLAAAVPTTLLMARPAWAETSDDLLGAVQKARESLKSLVAPFEQTRVIGLLAAPVQSKGELSLVRPDQLRWELFAPDDMIYWVNKEGVFFKNRKTLKSGKVRAGAKDFGNFLSDMLTFLGGDLKQLKARYDLSARKELSGSIVIEALPKADDVKKAVRKLELKTNPELWGVARIVIEEPSDDSSTITFGKNQRDAKIDPTKMKPPA